ncbi:MAG: Asp-tRNA(Asn)/Glu-tRNA(Gln) amidotransferase subunit GatA [bacterium JZ-2024 1]
MDLSRATLHDLLSLQEKREVSAREVFALLKRRRDELEPLLNAFIHRPTEARVNWDQPVLPIAVKDVLCTLDAPTTAGSRILEGFQPGYDAEVVARLRERNALFLGKTNLDEFAMGSSTENSAYGPSRNPWALERVPGGSSGGSAVAVAAGVVPVALGTDTGGSVRLPASYCGIFGLRPTYGAVSRWGLIAFASSLDTVGVFARTVEDLALVFSIIAGYDPKDSTSQRYVPPALDSLKQTDGAFRIGLVKELTYTDETEPEVIQNVSDTLQILASMGCQIGEVSLPLCDYALDSYYVVAPAEASSNLARYDGILFGPRVDGETSRQVIDRTRSHLFGAEVKRRIILGTFALRSEYYMAYYAKAMNLRRKLAQELLLALNEVDLLLSPTSPCLPFKIGERTASPLKMYLADIGTIPAALAGLPALSFPTGFAEVEGKHLPLGMQVMAKPFQEERLLRFAWAFQEFSGFKNMVAPI